VRCTTTRPRLPGPLDTGERAHLSAQPSGVAHRSQETPLTVSATIRCSKKSPAGRPLRPSATRRVGAAWQGRAWRSSGDANAATPSAELPQVPRELADGTRLRLPRLAAEQRPQHQELAPLLHTSEATCSKHVRILARSGKQLIASRSWTRSAGEPRTADSRRLTESREPWLPLRWRVAYAP
jgi:hypothetical protein